MNQSALLTLLCRAPAEAVKMLAETLIPQLEPITVIENRTGLVMVPLRDTVDGTIFFVGEALIAEAHVRAAGAEGYAACLGRDLEQALAIALIDAAHTAGVALPAIAAFAGAQAAARDEADAQLRRAVAATRVEMETF